MWELGEEGRKVLKGEIRKQEFVVLLKVEKDKEDEGSLRSNNKKKALVTKEKTCLAR